MCEGSAPRGERELYGCSEVGLYEEGGPSSGGLSPSVPGSQNGEAEIYAGSDKEEKDDSCVS